MNSPQQRSFNLCECTIQTAQAENVYLWLAVVEQKRNALGGLPDQRFH